MNFAQNIKAGSDNVLPTVKWRVVNRGGSAVAIGDLMSFDLVSTQSETTAGQGPGGLTGLPVNDAVWLNIIDPVVPAGVLSAAYCVVVDLLDGAGADNTEVEVAIQGYVTAAVLDAGSFTRNLALVPAATASLRQLILYTDSINRVVALIATPVASTGVEVTTTVAFMGWAGMWGGMQT